MIDAAHDTSVEVDGLVDWTAKRFHPIPLRKAMVLRGYTTPGLAKATGLGLSTIQKVRQGRDSIADDTINRVLEALSRRRPLEVAS